MIEFRENNEKNCNFIMIPPPPQKVGKETPIFTIFLLRVKII